METNVAIAWVAGIAVGVLFGGVFAYAFGLQEGKKMGVGTSGMFLTRDDVMALVGHRMQEIVRIVRARLSPADRQWHKAGGDEAVICGTEFNREYHRLAGAFKTLRRPEVENAVRHLIATPQTQARGEEGLTA